MVEVVAHTSAIGAEGDVEGVWLLGVRPGGVHGDCREGVGAEESEDVEARARFLKVCEGGDGVREEDTVWDMPAGWMIEVVD